MSQYKVSKMARKIAEVNKKINSSYGWCHKSRRERDVLDLVHLEGYFAGLCYAMGVLTSGEGDTFLSTHQEASYERLLKSCRES